MNRKEEIMCCFQSLGESVSIIKRLVEEMLFIEQELDRLKGLPFFRVHPVNPNKQEETAASKAYNGKMSRYSDIVSKLCTILRREDAPDESPLRTYVKEREKKTDEQE